jgi:NAD(P)-dependent dehydrogenase (short-subunit alcohol dehydrogenase family)
VVAGRGHERTISVGASAYAALGGLDLLVNNAGIGMRTVNPRFMTDPQPFWQVPPAGFRDVLDSKVTGSFLVAREVVPRMLRAGGGRIVTISMSEQTMTMRGFVPYGPAGSAVEALARVMAADLAGTPVTANILLPGGPSDTGMIPDEIRGELRAKLLDPAIMGPPIVSAGRACWRSGGSQSNPIRSELSPSDWRPTRPTSRVCA